MRLDDHLVAGGPQSAALRSRLLERGISHGNSVVANTCIRQKAIERGLPLLDIASVGVDVGPCKRIWR